MLDVNQFVERPEANAVVRYSPLGHAQVGRVPWSGGNEGVVVNLSDGARVGR